MLMIDPFRASTLISLIGENSA